jgi:hypothetical protein
MTTTLLRELYKQEARRSAGIEHEQNKDSWDKGLVSNSPWAYDIEEAVRLEFKKENKVVDALKNTYKSFGEIETFYDFIGIFGICGVNKLSGAAIKCLSGGLTLDQFYDAAIELLLESLSVESFERLYDGLPNNIKKAINESISENLGDVSITDMLGFTKAQNSQTTLAAIIKPYRSRTKKTMEIMQKHPHYPLAPKEIQKEYEWALSSDTSTEWIWGSARTVDGQQQNTYYNFTLKQFKPNPPLDTLGLTEEDIQSQNKADKKLRKRVKRRFKKKVRNALYKKDADSLGDARRNFSNLFMSKRARANASDELTSLARKKMVLETDSDYDQAVKDYSESNIGKNINKIISAVLIETIETLIDVTPSDDLFALLRQFPIPDVVLNVLEGLLKPCPNEPLFFPPPSNFLNSFKLDVCDPSIQLTFPKLVVPSIDFKSQIKSRLRTIIRDELSELFIKTVTKLLIKILNSLEGSLCKALELAGGLVADLVDGENFGDSWYQALDEAFCGGNRDHSEKLNNEIFNRNAELAKLAANIISGVAGTKDVLDAMAYPDPEDQDDNVMTLIANAINALAPELSPILGSPSLVGIAFSNLAGKLSPSDRDRIRILLDEGVPNLPISSAICLTNEQLDEWNAMREELLSAKGLSPEDARAQVNKLNDLTQQALEDFLQNAADLQNPGGPFLAPLQDVYGGDDDEYPSNPLFGPDSSDPSVDPATLPGGGIDDVYKDDEPPCTDPLPPQKRPDELVAADMEDELEKDRKLLEEFMKRSFYGKGGIFNESLRDREDKGLTGHALRVSQRYLWPNWSNSPEEWEAKYDEAGFALGLVMDIGGKEGDGIDHIGTFPQTVGAKMREELLAKDTSLNMKAKYENKLYPPDSQYGYPTYKPSIFTDEVELNAPYIDGDNNLSNNSISLNYTNDQTENESRKRRGYFEYNVNSTFHPRGQQNFNIYTSIVAKVDVESQNYSKEFGIEVPISPTIEERKIISTTGIVYGEGDYSNIRSKIFNNFLNRNYSDLFLEQDYSDLYEKSLLSVTNAIKNASVTDPRTDMTYGFTFGYTPDDLTEEHFDTYTGPNGEEYNYPEESKVLGKYGNDRIVVLSPEIYGGRYSNPPFWLRPMQQGGWLDASDAIFGGNAGCEPRPKGALSFKDVFDRAKKIEDNLSPDPLLEKDQDCISRRPFNHLVLPSTHAGIEMSVRTTIRLYSTENFLKGLGVYSNFLYNEESYDNTSAALILNRMKEDLQNSGSPRNSRKIRIKRKNYWYTFLEQCVQVYNRMVELDGIEPSESVKKALQDIGDMQRNYIDINKKIKRKYFDPDYEITLPNQEYFYELGNSDSYDVTDVQKFYHDAMVYRIYGEEMFKIRGDQTLNLKFKNSFSLKKMRFFSKIFAIRLVERQCSAILLELIKSELRIIAKRFDKSASTGAYYKDLLKSMMGFKELYPNSTLTYGTINPGGEVPSVQSSPLTVPGQEGKATFLIEKYVKVVDKDDSTNVPLYVKNRQQQFRGVMPFDTFQGFIDSIPDNLLIKQDGTALKVSDCFGNLQFTYMWSIKEILGFIAGPSSEQSGVSPDFIEGNITLEERISKLIAANPDNPNVRFTIDNHIIGREYEDYRVLATQDLIPPDLFEITEVDPISTVGDLGVFHCLRISIITPKGSILKKITSRDLLDAISNKLGSNGIQGVSIGNLASGIRGLADLFSDAKSDLLSIATQVVTNLDEGVDALIDTLISATESSENIDLQNLDTTIRDLANSLGIELDDIPQIGDWCDSSLNPIPNLSEILSRSADDKTFLFDDGNFVLPIANVEYSLIDDDIQNFNVTNYDTECLINKMAKDPTYTLMFDKLFCSKTILSMVGSYCMFGFLPSQGFGEGERTETDNDPGSLDYFDGRHNRRLKNFLRKQFASFYLSNDIDGQSAADRDDDDDDLETKFKNPFRGMELAQILPKVKFLQKLRIRTNPYDVDGIECADPMRDLME